MPNAPAVSDVLFRGKMNGTFTYGTIGVLYGDGWLPDRGFQRVTKLMMYGWCLIPPLSPGDLWGFWALRGSPPPNQIRVVMDG